MIQIYKILIGEYQFYTGGIHKRWLLLRAIAAYLRAPAFRLIVLLRLRNHLKLPAFIWSNYFLRHFSVDISRHATLGKRLRFAHLPGIVIGTGSVLGDDCILFDGVLIGQSHGAFPKIGNRVTLCAHCCVLGGVSVGDDVIVLANSVVTHDVPANSIVAGIPAKVLKEKGDIRV